MFDQSSKARNTTELEDNTVEKSNDEIISTIVDMLENEKAMRIMNGTEDEQSKQHDRKTTKQRENGKKRAYKRHSKKEKHKRTKHKNTKHKKKHNRHKVNVTRGLYKKDHIGRISGGRKEDDDDDNLMKEEEDYLENNGMVDE